MEMFCYQCEQTAKGQGCTISGVCGKNPQVAALQDLLTYALKGLAIVAHQARQQGIADPEIDRSACRALFSTLTNVDFDPERFPPYITQAVDHREELKAKLGQEFGQAAANFQPAASLETMVEQASDHPLAPAEGERADIIALQHTSLFGLRGVAAYADHAAILGQEDAAVYAGIYEILAAMEDESLDLNTWVGLTLKVGEINLKAMELLDAGNTGTYGHPVPTEVPLGHKAGKAILVSGHDLMDLEELLEQSQGKGIYVYTHGEMLPCHAYPKLKAYDHFHGHYGTAWQNQGKEFPAFPGAILMTTNCIQKPKGDTGGKMFTTGLVGWPGIPHIPGIGRGKDFGPVIEKALELPGFPTDEEQGSVMCGFGRNAVMGVADKVIEAVKGGAIKHFFLVAGCDGAKPGRNYYTEFVEKVPQDSVVLTLACGKFRFFDKKLGDIGGIPRLLDIGQCNDAHSAIQIAVALAGAFDCGVNDLPLSMVLSWYEQKACAILLSLLHLGIKDIRLGPSLPAFITPNVLQVLVDNFNIMPITTPDEDLKAILGEAA
ncbi:MAG: hydroxylamine reductase [Desulfarculaceae bacterium]|nr:hydroxylamine reductase [Desulfarculaceae bacterium]MCF8074483.1 hydroxylamine reductase [Desulfarculaceae bacterium]MCF8103675.1 hydroxylamine reductase [Desulfarculaceae bacterium]